MSLDGDLHRLFEAPIPGIESISPRPSDRSDSIRFRRIPPMPFREEFDNDIDGHVYRRLGHIEVDLHDVGSVEAMRETYVFSKRSGNAGNVANRNGDTQKSLVDKIIQVARRQRDEVLASKSAFQRLNPPPRHLFILHGDRGVGKSTFLHHTLAEHSQTLNDNKTIWVRIDLARFLADLNTFTVLRRITAKLTKLLIRYFDVESPITKEHPHTSSFDVCHQLLEQIKSTQFTDETKAELRRNLDHLKRSFWARRNVPVDEQLVNITLADMALDTALANGHSVVAVIDGLDRLDTTERAGGTFDILVQQFSDLVLTQRSGLALLVVCREESRERLRFVDDTRVRSEPFDYIVAPVPVREILRKRMPHIRKEILGRIPDEQGRAKWDREFSEFVDRVEHLDLEGLFPGNNAREHIQVVQLTYHDHVSERRRRAYLLTESVVLIGRDYPPEHFRYKEVRGRIERHAGDLLQFDHRFYPCIFSYPRLPHDKGPLKGTWDRRSLLGIRILQLLRAAAERDGEMGELRADDLTEMLSLFDYDSETTITLIEELKEFDIVDISGGDFEISSERERYIVRELPKARVITTRMINEVAYLNLAAMRMSFAKRAFERSPSLVYAMSADPSTDPDYPVARAKTKIVNATAAYRLCRMINLDHQATYDLGGNAERRLQASNREVVNRAVKNGMFHFHERMGAAITDQANKILVSLDSRGQSEVAKFVEEYAKAWI